MRRYRGVDEVKRSIAIALIRTAGYHNDSATFTRLYVENRISLKVAKRAFAEGRKLKAGGVGCTCLECQETTR